MAAIRAYKDRLETLGLAIMMLGILLLVQPLALALYTLGFPVLLIGFVFFIVVSHL